MSTFCENSHLDIVGVDIRNLDPTVVTLDIGFNDGLKASLPQFQLYSVSSSVE